MAENEHPIFRPEWFDPQRRKTPGVETPLTVEGFQADAAQSPPALEPSAETRASSAELGSMMNALMGAGFNRQEAFHLVQLHWIGKTNVATYKAVKED